MITYSGKSYLIDKTGCIITVPGFYSYYSDYVYVRDSSGQLAKGLITIKGKRYFFKSDCYLNTGMEADINGKAYMTNPSATKGSSAPEEFYILSKKDLDELFGNSI